MLSRKRMFIIYWVVLMALPMFVLNHAVYAQTEVQFWSNFGTPATSEFMRALIKAFEQEQPGIKVVHRAIPDDMLYGTVRNALLGNDPPEIVQHDGYQQVRDYAQAGVIMDLTDWWESHEDRFVPAARGSNNEYEGRVYSVPWTLIVGNPVFYNVRMLEEAGLEPPQTWDEFVEIMEDFKSRGIDPIGFGNKEGWPGMQWWMQFLLQTCGADKVNALMARDEPGMAPKWTDPDVVRSAEYYVDLFRSGYFSVGATSNDYQTGAALFMAERTPFFHAGSFFLQLDFPPALEWDLFEFPRIETEPHGLGKKDMIMSFLYNFSVTERSQNKEAALKFLEFMTRPEWAREWVRLVKSNVAVQDGNTPDVMSDQAYRLMELLGTATGYAPFLDGNLPPTVGEDKIYNGSMAVLTGEMTSEEWMKSIEDAHNRAISDTVD